MWKQQDNVIEQTYNNKAVYKTRLELFFEKEHIKDIFIRCIYGFLMGISDGIPGYSGSTTLTIFGFYPKFMQHARMLFGVNKYRRALRSLFWLFPFGIFWLIAAFLFAKFVTWFSSQGFDASTATFTNTPFTGQLILFIAFASVSFFSLPIFFYFHKKVLFLNSFKEYKKPKNWLLPILFLIGFCIIIALGLYIHFCLTTTIANHTFKGFLVSNAGYKLLPKDLYGKLAYIAIITGLLLFIPGISSSFIMLLFNFYSYTYTIIHDHPLLNIIPLLITCSCVLSGIVLNVFTISFLLKRFPKHFYNFSAGIISGAFITILLCASPTLYAQAHHAANIVFIIFVLLIAMMINGFIFLNFYNKNKKHALSFGKYTL